MGETGPQPPTGSTSNTIAVDAHTRRRGYVLAATAALIWSTGGLIVRLLGDLDPWTTVFWRSVFATLFLAVFVLARDRGRVLKDARAMGWAGIVVALCFTTATIGMVNALQLTSVANVLVILSAAPILAALIGRVVMKERVPKTGWWAMAAAGLGVLLMVSDSDGTGQRTGDAIAFLITLALAVATVTIRHKRAVRMAPATGLGAAIAAVIALPLAGSLAVSTPDFALLVVFGALQLGLGLALFTTGARLAPAADIALIMLIEPILGPLWVWAILNEHPGTMALIGGGIVLGAVLVHIGLDLHRSRSAPPAA